VAKLLPGSLMCERQILADEASWIQNLVLVSLNQGDLYLSGATNQLSMTSNKGKNQGIDGAVYGTESLPLTSPDDGSRSCSIDDHSKTFFISQSSKLPFFPALFSCPNFRADPQFRPA
jgi:hypothetical protein